MISRSDLNLDKLLTSKFFEKPNPIPAIQDEYKRDVIDLNAEFQVMRIEYVAASLRQAIENEDDPLSSEIHYGNAINNFFAKALEVPVINESQTDKLNQPLLDRLKTRCVTLIRAQLTAENVISSLVNKIALDDVIKLVNEASFDDAMLENINTALNRYGIDEKFIDKRKLIVMSNNGCRRSWRADYILFLSIAERLSGLGFIDAFAGGEKALLGNKEVTYFSDRSLRFSYIYLTSFEDGDKTNHQHEPLIVTLVRALYGKNTELQKEAYSFINRLTTEQKLELSVACIKYFDKRLQKSRHDQHANAMLAAQIVKDIVEFSGNYNLKILREINTVPLLFEQYFSGERKQTIIAEVNNRAVLEIANTFSMDDIIVYLDMVAESYSANNKEEFKFFLDRSCELISKKLANANLNDDYLENLIEGLNKRACCINASLRQE